MLPHPATGIDRQPGKDLNSGWELRSARLEMDPFEEQKEAWNDLKRHTPEKKRLARRCPGRYPQWGRRSLRPSAAHPITAEGGGYIGKQMLVAVYREMVAAGEIDPDPALLAKIRMKPTRTQSGVTVVTVLTKPYPCPGKCIFCPDRCAHAQELSAR